MGKNVLKPVVTEAGCFGAAMLAGVGTGIYKSAYEAAEQLVKIDTVIEPDIGRHKIYQQKMEKYKGLYPALKKLM